VKKGNVKKPRMVDATETPDQASLVINCLDASLARYTIMLFSLWQLTVNGYGD
jgi:hypothetical protein